MLQVVIKRLPVAGGEVAFLRGANEGEAISSGRPWRILRERRNSRPFPSVVAVVARRERDPARRQPG